MTLADLRTLLTLAHGPAVERLEDRTPEGVARAYLPREVFALIDDEAHQHHPPGVVACPSPRVLARPLDLTDPGTVHALKVALALALGLDPGAMGVGASWRPRLRVESSVWTLHTTTGFESFVINEPDPIKALILACQHVIKGKS